MKATLLRLIVLTLAVLGGAWGLVSCSSAPAPSTLPPAVWPAPPAQARIRHLADATRPAGLGATVRGFSRWVGWITGSEKGNEPFERPFCIALDEDQNLLIADTGANTVGWLDVAARRWQRWEAIGGRPFRSPVAVAKKGGLVYVADSAAGEVIAFDLKGALKLRIKEGLINPCGLAWRGRQLLVADSQRHAVLIFDENGRLEGQIGVRGSGPGEFNFPTHLATDSKGQLYVTDSMNGRIQVFDGEGKFLRQIGSPGDRPGHFRCPKGVAVDREGRVFVLDAVFDCMQIFNVEGKLLLSLGQTGAERGEFWLPNGIAIGNDNRIYVADTHNRRIQVFLQLSEP